MGPVKAPVFISYASKDGERALEIVAALESHAIPCWIACRDVPSGDNYADHIPDVIAAAPALVLVFSSHAGRSEEVKKEVQLASQGKVHVIPIRIEDVQPSAAFKYELTTRQWIDAFAAWKQGLEKLVRRIEEISQSPQQQPPVTVAAVAADRVANRRSGPAAHPRFVVGAGVAAVVLLLAVVLHMSHLSAGPEQRIVASLSPVDPPRPLPPNQPLVPPAPRWEKLPLGSNFRNLSERDVSIYRTPNSRAERWGSIIPGGSLFPGGLATLVERAVYDGVPWLRFEADGKFAFVLESSVVASRTDGSPADGAPPRSKSASSSAP